MDLVSRTATVLRTKANVNIVMNRMLAAVGIPFVAKNRKRVIGKNLPPHGTHMRYRVVAGVILIIIGICLIIVGMRPLLISRAITPADAVQSVYKINVDVQYSSDDDEIKHHQWSGTAWVAEHTSGHTYLVTAGHVCETRKEIPSEDDDDDNTETYNVKKVNYTLVASDGTEVPGVIVLIDDDNIDLCVLSVGTVIGTPLPISHFDPAYGTPGWYIGAPHGLWGAGFAGLYNLTYSGRGNPLSGECLDDMAVICSNDAELFSVSGGASGCSGSPAIVNGQVVAVLNIVAYSYGWGAYIQGVPWEAVRQILDRANHRVRQ